MPRSSELQLLLCTARDPPRYYSAFFWYIEHLTDLCIRVDACCLALGMAFLSHNGTGCQKLHNLLIAARMLGRSSLTGQLIGQIDVQSYNVSHKCHSIFTARLRIDQHLYKSALIRASCLTATKETTQPLLLPVN